MKKNNSRYKILQITLLTIITGVFNNSFYLQNFTFNEITGTGIAGAQKGSNALADFDNDGDLDIIVTGLSSTGRISKLYVNDGSGSFTEDLNNTFIEVTQSSVAVADIDADGDTDILISGGSINGIDLGLYENDGTGSFTLKTGTPFLAVVDGDIEFSDVDMDGDQDVLISGQITGNNRICRLYTNDGVGGFTLVSGTSFTGVNYSSVTFSDIDGDLDNDVLITGFNGSTGVAKLYSNNGSGVFTEITSVLLAGIYDGFAAFSDVDNDNDLDLIINGNTSSGPICKLYTNNGQGIYTEDINNPFPGTYGGDIKFSDFDVDGDKDLIFTGKNSNNFSVTLVYSNDGTGSFNQVTGHSVGSITESEISLADIDGDNYLEMVISGRLGNQRVTKLYEACLFSYGTDVKVSCVPYTWIDGNTYSTSTNTPTFNLTNQKGCDSVVTLDLTINSVGDLSTVVSGIEISAMNANATSYQWIDCINEMAISGETANTFTPTINGEYAVVINDNNCTDTSACTLISSVGLDDVLDEKSPIIFPNPTYNNLQILWHAEEHFDVLVFNTSGQCVMNKSQIKSSEQINLDVCPGTYYISIRTSDGIYHKKFLKL